MATERIIIEVEARGLRTVNRQLDRTARSAKRSATILQQLRNILVVVAAARVIGRLTDLADSFINLRNRLQATLGSFGAARAAQAALLQIALETRTGIDATGDAFARLALGAKDLGLSTKTLLGVTKTLNQAIILSGATAQEAQNAMIQLSQGIASGALRGDELRAVLEQLPLVARIIADEFDVPLGKLRELGEEGKLVTSRLIAAFQKAAPQIAKDFGNTIVTIDQALSNLTTRFTAFLDTFSQATGITAGLANAITGVGKAFDFLADNMKVVSGVLATLLTLGFLKLVAVLGIIPPLITAISVTIAALRTGILGLALVAGLVQKRLIALALANPFILAAVAISLFVGVVAAAITGTESLSDTLDENQKFIEINRRAIELNTITTTQAAAARSELTRVTLDGAKADLEQAKATLVARDALGELSSVGGADQLNKDIERLTKQVEELGEQALKTKTILEDISQFSPFGDNVSNPVFDPKAAKTIQGINFEIDQLKRTVEDQAFQEALKKAGAPDDPFVIKTIRNRVNELLRLEEVEKRRGALRRKEIAEIKRLRALAKDLFETSLPLSERAKIIDIELAKVKGFLVKLTMDEAQANRILATEKARQIDLIKKEIAPDLLEFLDDRKTLTDKIADAEATAVRLRLQSIEVDGDVAKATELSNKFLAAKIKLLKDEEAASGIALKNRFNLVAAQKAEITEARTALAAARGAGRITEDEEVETLRQLRRELVGAGNDSERFAEKQQLIGQARRDNLITAEEEIRLLRTARVELLENQRTTAAGAERAFLKLVDDATNAAQFTEMVMTDAFKAIEDAVISFAETGKFSVNDFFQNFSRQLLRLGTQQAIAGIGGAFQGAIGGQTGLGAAGGAGAGGGIGGLIASFAGSFLSGAQHGANFEVGPNTALQSLSGVDNRLVAFRARDGEEVKVTPKNQVGSGRPVVVNMTVVTPDADSFNQSRDQILTGLSRGLDRVNIRDRGR